MHYLETQGVVASAVLAVFQHVYALPDDRAVVIAPHVVYVPKYAVQSPFVQLSFPSKLHPVR